MPFGDLGNGRRRDDWDGIFEECFAWLETVVNSATGSAENLFGTGIDLLPLDDSSTTFDRVLQSGPASTDEQPLNFLSFETAFPINELTGFPLINNSADWPTTHQHGLDVGNMGGMGSAGMEYLGVCSSETSSSLSPFSSPLSWGLSNPTSPGTQSSYTPYSPVAIATGYEGPLLPNNMRLSESVSPTPPVPVSRSTSCRKRSREITRRGRKRVGETK